VHAHSGLIEEMGRRSNSVKKPVAEKENLEAVFQDADYQLVGSDVSTATDTSPACNLHFDDEEACPSLLTTNMSLQKEATAESTSPVPPAAEATMDWILVPASKADLFDKQHPRNLFGKKQDAKQVKSQESSYKLGLGIDWSQEGIPTEIKKQIIHTSITASHRGFHAKDQASPLPIGVLRAQNHSGSYKRENSVPKKTPRSASKPKVLKQPAAGRR
jgi:hypothetical protein